MSSLRCGVLCASFVVTACEGYEVHSSYWNRPAGSSSPTEPTPAGDQEVVIADVRPPPLTGGTLLLSHDGTRALVSDPDRDRILIVDLERRAILNTIPTEERAEPGRAVEDAQGLAHVVLRGAGAILSVNLATGAFRRIRSVCVAPRGIAYESSVDSLYVACVSGSLVQLGADPDAGVVAVWSLDRDLRDVVSVGGKLLVSRFRSAEILAVGLDGAIGERVRPSDFTHTPMHDPEHPIDFEPSVAWRLAALANGGAMMIHQRVRTSEIVLGTGGASYVGDCSMAVVHAAITAVEPSEPGGPIVLTEGTVGALGLPVDVAATPDGSRIAILGALNRVVVELAIASADEDGCSNPPTDARSLGVSGDPIAVGYLPDNRLIVQMREPPMLDIYSAITGAVIESIELVGTSRRDTGYDLFHGTADGGALPVACASCHPEGREDGRVWNFGEAGLRRTQSLVHGVLGTAPFHWDGALANMRALVDEVMVGRMGNLAQSDARVAALEGWLGSLERLPPLIRVEMAQAARGEALFHDDLVGCADCHAGPKLTNNESEDVGTGGTFQIPSLLGVGARAPFLHDGCAATLHDRFSPACGDDRHGVTSHLTPADIDDLVAYLETL